MWKCERCGASTPRTCTCKPMSDPIPSSSVSPDPWKDVAVRPIHDFIDCGEPETTLVYRASAVNRAKAADDARHQQEIADLKARVGELEFDASCYCPNCGACGEEGCCPAPKCAYFKTYTGDLGAKVIEAQECEKEMRDLYREGEARILELKTKLSTAEATIASLTAQVEQQAKHIAVCEHIITEHGEFGGLFQPGGRFYKLANLPLGRSAVVEGGRWLVQQYDTLRAERDAAQQEIATLREALKEALPFVATQRMACCGLKCRELWCESCFGEEEAEEVAEAGRAAALKASAALQSTRLQEQP